MYIFKIWYDIRLEGCRNVIRWLLVRVIWGNMETMQFTPHFKTGWNLLNFEQGNISRGSVLDVLSSIGFLNVSWALPDSQSFFSHQQRSFAPLSHALIWVVNFQTQKVVTCGGNVFIASHPRIPTLTPKQHSENMRGWLQIPAPVITDDKHPIIDIVFQPSGFCNHPQYHHTVHETILQRHPWLWGPNMFYGYV